MKSLPHDSAQTHVTGESEYVDDRPFLKNELQLYVVYSEKAHARLKRVDLSKALKVPGIVAAYTAKDLRHNLWGTIFQDQPLIAEDTVQFVGEAIAILAGESSEALREARKLVRIEYQELEPVLSIADARRKKSFIGSERSIARGDVEKALASSAHTIEDRIVIQGADHFYLESQASIAYPLDSGGVEIHSSSQHPTEVQHVVAHALGLESKDVTVVVKRMGGGFGGKESQGAPFAAYAALVAHKLKRPARIVLTKDDDMIMTGKRNPFEIEYRVGFDRNGALQALDARLYSDGGAYADLSTAIMERAMLHCDNAYFIPNVRVIGQVCKLHYHPHTAFRGFGGPKGVAMIEKIVEQVALKLGKDAIDVRKLNCYQGSDRNTTHYGQVVENNVLPELFEKLEKSSDYRNRRKEIGAHNRAAGPFGLLRGLSLTAVKFGISFTTRFLNQANALVIVHRDGSVQVSTGATEMGQGANARIRELVAEELGIDPLQVKLMPTSTDKNANTSPTAASTGTDLNGTAAVRAARRIRQRLSEVAEQIRSLPQERWAAKTAGLGTEKETVLTGDEAFLERYRFANGVATSRDGSWSVGFGDLVNEAYLNRVSLSEYAHYSVPHLSFNKLTGKGRAFLYYTMGTAATEVSIDPVSGEVKVLRTDILMDLGRPINEGLDVGQVIGAYIQGMGWVTTENLYYSPGGKLLSHSPSTYKIPNIQDTPRVFNVELLHNPGNTVNIRGTKAAGEPPLLLALSVWTAIGDAIASRTKRFPDLRIPATSERVLRALSPEKFAPWEPST